MNFATIEQKQYNHLTGITPDVPEGSRVIDAYLDNGNIMFVWVWGYSEKRAHRKHVLLGHREGPFPEAGLPRYEYQNLIVEMPDGRRQYLFESIGEDVNYD